MGNVPVRTDQFWKTRGKGIESTFINYRDFGPHGSMSFHGVTNSLMVKDFIDTYAPRYVFDPMAGSGTVRDLCDDMHIPGFYTDLSPQPTPSGSTAVHKYDLMSGVHRQAIKTHLLEDTGGLGPDFIWFDPPYWRMVRYSDDPRDLSTLTYSAYLEATRNLLGWLGSLLAPRGVICFECGDYRVPGTTYFITDDVITPDVLSKGRMRKDIRVVNGFPLDIRSPEGYAKWLASCRGRDYELDVELMHEYITVLRSTKPDASAGK